MFRATMLLTAALIAGGNVSATASTPEAMLDPAYWSYSLRRIGLRKPPEAVVIHASVFSSQNPESVFHGKKSLQFEHGNPSEQATIARFLAEPLPSLMPETCEYVDCSHPVFPDSVMYKPDRHVPRLLQALAEE